jgi:osmotically-inducible protein OsmY
MAWITTRERTTYAWQDVPADVVPNDREMKSALVHRLKENLFTTDASIKVEVDNRVIVLTGEVDSPMVRRAAGDDAWDTPGVMDVSNQLVVASGH